MSRKISVFDTTLRDGEQSPGASMNIEDKVLVAQQLLHLGVDVIEAGFPVSSPGDFRAVRRIAEVVGSEATVCALSRAVEKDIEAAAEALRFCSRPRIQTGLGVSPQHLRDKLHISEEECLIRIRQCVKHARRFVSDVQFYAEDAGRADEEFLVRAVQAAIGAGASVINIPDTTGFCLPQQFGQKIALLKSECKGIDDVVLSVHCHNDLGMAVALSLEGIRNGATQVECTVNGLGERAGNAALEEVVMALRLHGEELDAYTEVNAKELCRASRLVSHITGLAVPANKAIVGLNAFSHSSGIHQDGVLKNPSTYEIIDPEEVGASGSQLLLTARSGRAALGHRLEELGYHLRKKELNVIYDDFLKIADKKKEIYDEDLESLVHERRRTQRALYTLEALQISCGFPLTPTATLTLRKKDGELCTVCECGVGPIDAAYRAIDRIVKVENDLSEFSVQSLTRGMDALGEVTIRIASTDGRIFTGRGSDGDIIVSAARAYLNALNQLLNDTLETQKESSMKDFKSKTKKKRVWHD